MKILILGLLLLSSLAFSQDYLPTFQQECTPVDLRTGGLGQVRNQKNISWCYAFTGADMIGEAYKLTEKVSAADIATAYNETRVGLIARWLDLNIFNRKDPEVRMLAHQTGFNKIALEKAMQNGWCPEEVFPSESWTRISQDGKRSHVGLDTAMKEISALHTNRENLTLENLPFHYQFKNISPERFLELLKSPTVAQFYGALRKEACKNDRRAFPRKFSVPMVLRNPFIFAIINSQLDQGRLVGIDYDSRVLKDHTNPGVKLSELHTSPFVGRKWNAEKNSCEYLVRNSYGAQCDNERYDPHYECEDGHIWLPEAAIYRNMTSAVYIQY